jgi:hypothetical protein
MITNWLELSKQIGSLNDNGAEIGGTKYTTKALDEILGNEWIENTVEHIIAHKPGSELAINCLQYLNSALACSYAYKVYKTADRERAQVAVWIIKQIAHPIALGWVKEFINDKNVLHLGLGVLDQLLWTDKIENNHNIEILLDLANKNSDGGLKPKIDFIRNYLSEKKLLH